MKYSYAIVALASYASAHGLVSQVKGANGVTMPGLGVQDGTPRDCASPRCGSEADTSIIRTREMGSAKASALGRTQGGGPVNAAADIAAFMGNAAPNKKRALSDLLSGLTGGAGGGAGGAAAKGTKTPDGTTEGGVAKAAGTGATSGLPTTADDGTISMTFHQVNQDGAGPLTAAIDPTSGGTDPSAFQDAQVTQDVPGIGIGGLSAAQTTDFPIKVQMPAGMTCSANVGGASNVCVVRVQNSALAGPFGGSGAFTQSPAARKRSIEYTLRKRHMARGVLGKEQA